MDEDRCGGENGDGENGGGNGGGSGGTGGTGGSGGSGGTGGSGGSGGGDGGGGLPPSGPSLCGPQEFLGGLPQFVAKIGNPNLMPTVINNDPVLGQDWKVFDFVTPDLPVLTIIGAPITVPGGSTRSTYRSGTSSRANAPPPG